MNEELFAGMEIPHTTFTDSFSEEVWSSTYRYHTDETIDDTLKRVAYAIAEAEDTPEKQSEWGAKFYEMLSGFQCTAGGRIYANAGTEFAGTTMMNCYVAPRRKFDIDSIDGIMADVLNQCQTLKSEGGWGQNFSYIRPRGSFIKGIGVESPGSVKYMEIFDQTSDVITAGSGQKSKKKNAKGKIRKGAMMGVLDIWHPDIEEFIRAKQQAGRLTKFNISVNCTDEFMEKVIRITDIEKILANNNLDEAAMAELEIEKRKTDKWFLRFPDTTHETYHEDWDGNLAKWEESGKPVEVFRTTSVMELWNAIMESTYNRAEPGVLFLDRANYFGPLNYAETIVATNPCGEQTLAPGGVCNLGSINLTQFVLPDGLGIDTEKLIKYIPYLVRFLDNINSISYAPLQEYMDSMRKKRRIGVGILGWGSALFMMKVRFGSARAHEIREEFMQIVARESYKASIDLAVEKGMFEYCEPEKHAEGAFIQSLDLPSEYMDRIRRFGIRNSSLLSCQPTGNTSIFANLVSGGIEPIFMPEYIRTVIVGDMPEEIADVTPKWFEGEWFETEMFKQDKVGDEEILKGTAPDGTVYKIDRNRGLTKEVKCQDYGVRWLDERGQWEPDAEWAVTTSNLSSKEHLSDLKGFARWVDSAISKTINLPNDYEFANFKDIYLDAYSSGYIKGITTYRAGIMGNVLGPDEEKDAETYEEEIIEDDVTVPSKAPAMVSTIRAEGKKWYLTSILNESQTRPIAFFVHTNHHEKSPQTLDAVDHLLNLAERKGIPPKWIQDTKDKTGGDNNSTKIARCISLNLRHGVLIKNVVSALSDIEDVFVGSFLFQIRKHLMTWIKDGEEVGNENGGADCPECDTKMVYREGCKICPSCSYSACG